MTTVPLREDNIQMLQKVIDFPSQVSIAYESLKDHPALTCSSARKLSDIVVLGMGASGVVGDFVRVLLRNSSIPIHVRKSAKLPTFINKETLVIAVTYSGKTRETLDALNTSIRRGAQNMVITSSNELDSVCAKQNIPCIKIPENGFPRATLGYMLVSVMGVLHKLGIAPSFESDISEALEVLEDIKNQCGPEVSQKSNPARLLGHSLVGRFPVIYGESDFTDVAALRWKQQINENAKTHCYYDVFPELLHNEIEAWHRPENGHIRSYALLLLRDSIHEKETGLHDKIEATKRVAESRGATVFDLWTRGTSELSRMLSLCYMGDFVSVYLAISRDIDPGPVHNIEHLKQVALSSKQEG